MQLLIWLQIYKIMNTGRKTSKKEVKPDYFKWTIHSTCQESLEPAYFAPTSLCLFPITLSALQRKQNLINPRFSSTAVTKVEAGLESYVTAPHMISRSISSFPPLSPSKGFQPSGTTFQYHRDSLQSSVDTRMGSSKGRTGGWLASCPPCRSHHPLIFISVLEIDLLHSPCPSPFSAFLPLTYSAHIRSAFLLPSVRFEMGLNSL